MGAAIETAHQGPVASRIAAGEGWSIEDVVCDLGSEDRPFEEHFNRATIAAVLDGAFECGTRSAKALLYPGALLLGKAGSAFECGHDHGRGDHCVAFHFDPGLFEEIASTAAGSAHFRFALTVLPPLSKLAWVLVESTLQAEGREASAAEELAIGVADCVLRTVSGGKSGRLSPLPRERRRVLRALQYIQEHSEESLALDELASVACMSKFHFLRCFRALVGVTPHQFLLALRLRRAAMKIRTTQAPITAIAFETGFGDLSTFNERFRAVFGMSPRRLRNSGRSGLLC